MRFEDAARLPRDAAPGERLNYSNLGYSALGRVVEKVTGKAYEAQLRDAILAPPSVKDKVLPGCGVASSARPSPRDVPRRVLRE